jgi:hypothetical protein
MEALGAFLSGVAAVVSALVSLRLARKSCDRRVEEVTRALREGMELGRR